MSKPNVIMIKDENGSEKPYRPVAARLDEFLRAYPVEAYRVEIVVQDEISQRTGLLKLYETAIAAGHKPEEVGLPPVSQVNALVFTAKLIDKSGNVLRNPSAQLEILKYKDRERGETAAFQRLLAQLGFAGEVLDADENADIAATRGAAQPTVSCVAGSLIAPAETKILLGRPAPAMKDGDQANLKKGLPKDSDRLLGLRRMIDERASVLNLPAGSWPTVGTDGKITDKVKATQLLTALMNAKSADAALEAIKSISLEAAA